MRGNANTQLRQALLASAAIVCIAASPAAQAQSRRFDVPAATAAEGVAALARQADAQILISARDARDKRTNAVAGEMSTEAALAALLNGTGLEARKTGEQTWAVVRMEAPGEFVAARGGRNRGSSYGDDVVPEGQAGISEILVVGSRSQNVDIRRTEDDAQPYVVFDNEEVMNSGASTVEDFLKARLPMNAQTQAPSQLPGSNTFAAQGGINLRGLGTNQTLILIDGRRAPSVFNGVEFGQPNLTGISPASIERIEILPATASGQYGGGATGGVVNIILKRDYSGLQISGDYGATGDGKAEEVRFNLSGGLKLEGGRTRITGHLSYSDRNPLRRKDRDFFSDAGVMYMQRAAGLPTGSSFSPIARSINIYGSTPNIFSAAPPFAATAPNLVFKPEYGSGDLGSPLTFVAAGAIGPLPTLVGSLAANAGRLNFADIRAPLLTGGKTSSVGLTLRRDLTSWLEMFIDGYRDQTDVETTSAQFIRIAIPSSSPRNPFQQNINVNIPVPNLKLKSETRANNLRSTIGFLARLPKAWSASAEFGYSRSKIKSSLNAVSGATPVGLIPLQEAAFSDPNMQPISEVDSVFNLRSNMPGGLQNTLKTYTVRLGGPVLRTRAGTAELTITASLRDDMFGSTVDIVETNGTPTSYTYRFPQSQKVYSLYSEMRLPIVATANASPLINLLELSGSVRYDKYSSRFTQRGITRTSPFEEIPEAQYTRAALESADYTIAARYAPFRGITFRASHATGFLGPSLLNIVRGPESVGSAGETRFANLRDPRRGDMPLTGDPNGVQPNSIVYFAGGGNPEIRPESSKGVSIGAIITPSLLPGFRISLDYTHVRKKDEITSTNFAFLIENEDAYPDRIRRGARLASDPPDWAGPIVFLDASVINVAKSKMSAIDIQADYGRELARAGTFKIYAVASHVIDLSRRPTPNSLSVDRAGFFDGPLRWRGNIGLDWSKGRWGAGWNMQYYGPYKVCPAAAANLPACEALSQLQGSTKVSSQTYHDVYLRFRLKSRLAFLSGIEANVAVLNVLNSSPPLEVGNINYSQYGDPRLRRFQVGLRHHF